MAARNTEPARGLPDRHRDCRTLCLGFGLAGVHQRGREQPHRSRPPRATRFRIHAPDGADRRAVLLPRRAHRAPCTWGPPPVPCPAISTTDSRGAPSRRRDRRRPGHLRRGGSISPALRPCIPRRRRARVVEQLTPRTRDIVIRDAFADERAPAHLTTREFTESVAALLDDGGLYLVNCADDRRLTSRAPRSRPSPTSSPRGGRRRRRHAQGRRTGNVVIAAAREPMEATAALTRALLSDPLPARILDGERARAFAGGAPVLRDPSDRGPDVRRSVRPARRRR